MIMNKHGWIDVFNNLVTNNKYKHLHQTAGWKDISDPLIWESYVIDVLDGVVKERNKIFEAGCGPLAFLSIVKKNFKDVEIFGIDESVEAIRKTKTELVDNEEKDNFSVGSIPQDLNKFPDDNFNVTLSNSVFQYLETYKIAYKSVIALLIITKCNGSVIIADVCDIEMKDTTEERLKKLWEGYGTSDRPSFLYFSKNWFNQFKNKNTRVKIRNVNVEGYERRKERFVVYIEKFVL